MIRVVSIGLVLGWIATTSQAQSVEWEILSLNGETPENAPNIIFNEDGSISGTTGCNRFVTSGRMKAGALVLDGPIAGTKMACPPGALTDQDNLIPAALESGLRSSADPFDTTLTLTSDTHSLVLKMPLHNDY